MKLCEEFKLYENMWDDESSVDSAELSDTIITALTKAFRRNDNVLIEAPFNANAVGICEKWVSDKGRSMTRLSVMTETESELEIKLRQAYSRKHIVLLEDVERLKPRVLSKLFAIICEEGSTEFTICVVVKALPFSSWNSRVFPVVVHGFTDEAIDESVNTDKPYKLSCTGSDLDDAITLNKVPAYLKNVKEVELVDRDRVPVEKYNQICKMLNDLGIKVVTGASGREPSKKLKEALDDKEYSVVYRLKAWSASQPDDEAFFDAETATDAIAFFMEYMLDPDNLDDDIDPADIITEDDIIIISVAPTGA
jgi:hypothetical protein